MDSPYHPGELAVQAAAGVSQQAKRIGNSIRATIPPPAREFLMTQPMLVLAGLASDRVWATILTGDPNFARALDDRRVGIDATPAPGDPLANALQPGDPVGLLAIDLWARRRMRLNGSVHARGDSSFEVEVTQIYANCPKYIQARELIPHDGSELSPYVHRSSTLTPEQTRWIEATDTFFLASIHWAGGADVSHRGGHPGFVRIPDPNHLVFPDYAGNMMFQTLGNIAADPRVGLVFLDFDGGRTLHLTGRAEIDWSPSVAKAFTGAERVVAVQIEDTVEITGVLPLRWRFLGYSPFNPE